MSKSSFPKDWFDDQEKTEALLPNLNDLEDPLNKTFDPQQDLENFTSAEPLTSELIVKIEPRRLSQADLGPANCTLC